MDPSLGELAQTPLMLQMMSAAYEGGRPGEIVGTPSQSQRERRTHIFSAYAASMFDRRQVDALPRDRVLHWLGWLARRMAAGGQKLFFVEQLQPDWLGSFRERVTYVIYARMLAGALLGVAPWLYLFVRDLLRLPATGVFEAHAGAMLSGLTLGVVAGTLAGCIDLLIFMKGSPAIMAPPHARFLRTVIHIASYALGIGIPLGVLLGLISLTLPTNPFALIGAGVLVGLVFGLYFGSNSRNKTLQRDIHTIDKLGWSMRKGSVAAGLWALYGLLVGGTVGGVLLFSGAFNLDRVGYTLLGTGLTGAAAGGALGMVFGGLKKSAVHSLSFNQGIHLTAQNTLLIAGLSGVCVALGFLSLRLVSAGDSLPVVVSAGITAAFLAALWYGGLDLIQHLTLRVILHRTGVFPFRYGPFLRYARRLTFMNRVGGGVAFMHASMAEYLAQRQEETQAEPVEGG